VFRLLHDLIGGTAVDAGNGNLVGHPGSFFILFTLGYFLGLGYAADELDESVTISLWGNGRDL
jgi:hypothetical protein